MGIILKDVSEMRKWAGEFAKGLVGGTTFPGPRGKRSFPWVGAQDRLNKAPFSERRPTVVALHGDLGMGKTEIARAIIQTLTGADTVVPSPTFTLVQTYKVEVIRAKSEDVDSSKLEDNKTDNYQLPTSSLFALRTNNYKINISHFDLYRITDPSELEEIGLNHACANDITLIEWPEIAESILPKDTIHIYITECNGGRKLEIKGEK
jgi:tRNA A37 threonylcarbamoyladenosine biosynthesis protein TsaE